MDKPGNPTARSLTVRYRIAGNMIDYKTSEGEEGKKGIAEFADYLMKLSKTGAEYRLDNFWD